MLSRDAISEGNFPATKSAAAKLRVVVPICSTGAAAHIASGLSLPDYPLAHVGLGPWDVCCGKILYVGFHLFLHYCRYSDVLQCISKTNSPVDTNAMFLDQYVPESILIRIRLGLK
jgi:hypothetical protein